VSTVPFGSLSKAAFVGAKTVKGPAPFNVSTRPAALTAATSVVWSFELTALSMMSFVFNIGEPPTIGLSEAAFELDTAVFEFIAEFVLLLMVEFELLRIVLAVLFEVFVAGDPQPISAAAEAVTVKNIANFLYITCLPKIEFIKTGISLN
jgi:hypothetical protein